MTKEQKDPAFSTQDHIVPKAHRPPATPGTTIPACRKCNEAKGKRTLPEFFLSRHFKKVRTRSDQHQWSMRDLWLAMALASVETASGYEKLVAKPLTKAGS